MSAWLLDSKLSTCLLLKAFGYHSIIVLLYSQNLGKQLLQKSISTKAAKSSHKQKKADLHNYSINYFMEEPCITIT